MAMVLYLIQKSNLYVEAQSLMHMQTTNFLSTKTIQNDVDNAANTGKIHTHDVVVKMCLISDSHQRYAKG